MGSRTNFAARTVLVPQGLGKKNDASADTTAILNPLTRTASTMQENAPTTVSSSLEKGAEEERASAPLENRRASLTKRGAAKDRISLLPDIPRSLHEGDTGDNGPNKMASRQVKANPVESATTLLSIERAVESENKVVVGAADAKTKRRALENDEDKYEIEYAPPPVAGNSSECAPR